MTKKAENGDVEAMENLAYAYYSGDGADVDFAKSMEWAQKAADQGSAYASMLIGHMYLEGYGVEPDYEKAFAAYEKAVEGEVADAYNNMGYMYELGLGTEQDILKALEFYQKAADHGDETGKENLRNITTIAQYFADAENGDAEKQLAIGLAYAYGTPINNYSFSQNFEAAKKWLTKAYENGSYAAATELGYLYDSGTGVEVSKSKAAEYYTLAAERDPYGMYNLGIFYLTGDAGTVDDEKAFAYIHEAASNGCPLAYEVEGDLLMDGRGTEMNTKAAAECYEKAISNASASDGVFYRLGILYLEGDGVERDVEKAREYFEKAADLGNEYAREVLNNPDYFR